MGNNILGGWRPSPSDRLGLGAPEHLGATTPPPSASIPLPDPLEQQCQDCTCNSVALAVQVEIARRVASTSGIPFSDAIALVTLPSRRWLYRYMRKMIGELGQDRGGFIWAVFQVAADVGWPAETSSDSRLCWPYEMVDPLVRDAQPPWSVKRAASDQKLITGARRITSVGNDRVLDCKRAIALGQLVVWGTDLDQAALDARFGYVWPGVRGPVIGGHAWVLHEYDGDVFGTRSSWGKLYANNGTLKLTADAVASPNSSDYWIVDPTVPGNSGTV